MEANRAEDIAGYIDGIAPGYGINTKDQLREFVANVAHESGSFRIKEENMNYTTVDRIYSVWPTRFTTYQRVKEAAARNGVNITTMDAARSWYKKELSGTKAFAEDYVKNPKALANLTYNGRMGNRVGTNDGYDFRGSGFMQLTGRESSEAYSKFHSSMEVVDLMHRVRTEDYWATDSACWEYAIALKLLPISIGDDKFKEIVKRINGGYIGLPERQVFFDKAKKYLV